MLCIPYTEEETKLIRQMSGDNCTDEEICQAIRETFGIIRHPGALARKRNRLGVIKFNIQNYIPAIPWLDEEETFIRDNHDKMTDAEIAVELTARYGISRSTSSVLRKRKKMMLRRQTLPREQPVINKKEKPYHKSFIAGGMTDEEKAAIEELKRNRGTIVNPQRPARRLEVPGSYYLTDPGKTQRRFLQAACGGLWGDKWHG